jgi:predicted secreted protein
MNKITILCIFLFCSCSSVVNIDSTNVIQEVILKYGDIVNIELESQMSTGYIWMVVSSEGFSLIDKQIVDSVIGDDPLTGKKEKQIFIFKSEKKGKYEIIIHYVKQWENGKKPEKIFTKSFFVE